MSPSQLPAPQDTRAALHFRTSRPFVMHISSTSGHSPFLPTEDQAWTLCSNDASQALQSIACTHPLDDFNKPFCFAATPNGSSTMKTLKRYIKCHLPAPASRTSTHQTRNLLFLLPFVTTVFEPEIFEAPQPLQPVVITVIQQQQTAARQTAFISCTIFDCRGRQSGNMLCFSIRFVYCVFA